MLNQCTDKLNKVCCDMTALPFKKKFDLILSSFDSVNYLRSNKNLLQLFKEVNNSLTEKGIFTFDAALESNSYKHQKTATIKGKIERIYLSEKKYLFTKKQNP